MYVPKETASIFKIYHPESLFASIMYWPSDKQKRMNFEMGTVGLFLL